ncbi:tether containing UBX domain for GLUT4 [Osmia lignaria lignaria]|uniref:tether containing UBX domain for GLUT4 n=1 Tax=Osmia lignaria lignaria TaxID=1437193 RepID=UPI00402BF4A0
MATNKNVIVLAPNGRRQNVKVTANTTILQMLEEVCQKQGYNVDDYDVKHFNQVLDPNAILRFTGLPNNAQLEMIPCTKTRLNSTVTIGVQLESGERLMAEFMPNVTLIEVLQHLDLNEDLEKVALTYMHCEIYGVDTLKKTTLKSLGLNNGRAVLRLIHRHPRKSNDAVSTKSESVKGIENSNSDNKATASNKAVSPIIPLQKEEQRPRKLEICPQHVERKEQTIIRTDETHKVFKGEEGKSVISMKKDSCESSPQTCYKREITRLPDIEFLGERNALVFNQAEMKPISRDELPDDFYDLTVDDAKILLRDVKRYRKELEEAPLLTTVQRQLNQEKRTLNQLNKYNYTIIRVHFADQFILQGLFQPKETVQMIKDFIKNYLADPNSDFVIFTTPPKCILDVNTSLINENLVPCANVYYSGPSALKTDVKQKVTDPKKVKRQVAEIRMAMINQGDQISRNDVKINSTNQGEINT